MSKVNTNTISIITIRTEDFDTAFSGEGRTLFPSLTKMIVKSTQITTEKLLKNLSHFVKSLSTVVQALPESCGCYDVDELTFSLSVNGSGKISLIGELSAGVKSGITIKLKKKRAK